jgi:AcrR family transcriptional regulator
VTDVEASDAIDGRTARRDRNRELVLDAVLDLFAEDRLAPNAADVAARSGVSLRSVYRYYEDIDALVQAALNRHLERIAPLFDIPDSGLGPLDDRVERFVTSRMRLYETAAPMMRAALVRSSAQPLLAERIAWARDRLREQTETMFAPELTAMPAAARRNVAAALDALSQFESAEHLRVTRGYTLAQTSEILRRSFTALLT